MTDFCAIAPTPMLDEFAVGRPSHLVLAHLIEHDQKYVDFYRREADKGATIICDNSAFEKFKAGEPMYPAEKLIEMATKVKADYIVLPDYPDQPGSVTLEAADQWAPVFRDAGFGTFFCPQSKIGDINDLADGFERAAQSPLIDYIGISILNIPNAYGVERGNKLQRYLSRWAFMQEYHPLISLAKSNHKLIHFLGMVDGPREIELMRPWLPMIDTWDSSGPIWAGLNEISYDTSPTGQVDGKFEHEVDFNFETDDPWLITIADSNLAYVDYLISNTN